MRCQIGAWEIEYDAAAGARLLGRRPQACTCPWCRNWRAVNKRMLPTGLVSQLASVGVDPGLPSDLYAFGSEQDFLDYRVWFHCAGAIQSGPQHWQEEKGVGKVRNYLNIRSEPDWLGVAVAPASEFVDSLPAWLSSDDDILQIDLRLRVPWWLDEERPPVFLHLTSAQ